MSNRVSIVGAGDEGFSFYSDLDLRGKDVLIYTHRQHQAKAEGVRENGCLQAVGEIQHTCYPKVTRNMEHVVRFSTFIIIAVPAYGQKTVFEELAKYDLSEHIIINSPGFFGSFVAMRYIKPRFFIETSTSPYASRVENGKVAVLAIKKKVPIASLPIDLDNSIRDEIGTLFSMPLHWQADVLENSLSTIAGVLHVPAMVMNTGWIEKTQGDLTFYKDGMSPSVKTVQKEIDRERLETGREFGYILASAKESMNMYYDLDYADLDTLLQEIGPHNSVKATPSQMNHRFLTQDVPYELVPLYQLGRIAGGTCPSSLACIILAGNINREDYLRKGRNRKELGFAGLKKTQIIRMAKLTQSDWERFSVGLLFTEFLRSLDKEGMEW